MLSIANAIPICLGVSVGWAGLQASLGAAAGQLMTDCVSFFSHELIIIPASFSSFTFVRIHSVIGSSSQISTRSCPFVTFDPLIIVNPNAGIDFLVEESRACF